MMNRKEFYEYVKDNVKDYLPDSYQNGEIRIEEVAKNNGLRLTGISIPQGDQRAVPMVYLDSLYMEYVNGKNLDSCVGDVADMTGNGMKNAWLIKLLPNMEILQHITQ